MRAIAAGASEPSVGQSTDLTNCDREPIHTPGAILPHGAMLVLSMDDLTIVQVAGDLPRLLGRTADALLGASAEAIFSSAQMAQLRALCGTQATLARPRHLLDPKLRVLPEQPLDASAFAAGDMLVLEFEDALREDEHANDPLACVNDMLAGLDAAPSLSAFCQTVAARVRDVTGYDRVMIYRFAEDESGWVFAESKADRLPAYLDLHYPASDIPRQARELYRRNWLRLITQVDYEAAPLVPAINPRTSQPLDMSQATLRDVSPMHREYLRNMGVDASMSISILQSGRLWGLIACHHQTPRRLPRHLRAVCEMFGAMISLQLEARERAVLFEARLSSRQMLQNMMRDLAGEEDYAEGLIRSAPELLGFISGVGGMVLLLNNSMSCRGRTPAEAQISALTEWLTSSMEGGNGIFVTDRLGEVWPAAKEFAETGSGLLALSVSREPRDFILWFRPELVQSVTWGGDPTKPTASGPAGERLTPRTSFAAWTETVRGRSLPWSEAEADAASDLRLALLDVVLRRIDAAARERERVQAQERLLMAELDHRVKNTLANIEALVLHTSKSAASLEEFAQDLSRRIQSMSRAHSLLTQSRWDGVALARLLREELDPYGGQGDDTVGIEGPAAILTPKAALALSLAVHELTTNAARHGALSKPGGRVAVHWEATEGGGVNLAWREHGGPEVAIPARHGFGLTLIERALSMETGGQSAVHFEPDGLRCDIHLPADSVVRFGDSAAPVTPRSPEPGTPSVQHSPKRILVVEDSALVAMVLEEIVTGLGWEMIGPATRAAEAASLAQSVQADAALLDINLDGEMSWDAARALRERNIPFVFLTGYEGSTVLPPEFAGADIMRKPFVLEDVERKLMAMVQGSMTYPEAALALDQPL